MPHHSITDWVAGMAKQRLSVRLCGHVIFMAHATARRSVDTFYAKLVDGLTGRLMTKNEGRTNRIKNGCSRDN